MSRDVGLDIRFHGSVPPLRVLLVLQDAGWRIADVDERILYLPVGDAGRYDWQSVPIGDAPAVMSVLEHKAALREQIGVTLLWGDSQCGGTFRLEESFLAVTPVNPVAVGDVTDVTWYLERIVQPLLSASLPIVAWEWSEHG